jgi:hypothetical protein
MSAGVARVRGQCRKKMERCDHNLKSSSKVKIGVKI